MEEEQKMQTSTPQNSGMGKGLYIGVAVVFILLLLAYFAFKGKNTSSSSTLSPVTGSSEVPTSSQNPSGTGQVGSTTVPTTNSNLIEVTSSGYQPAVLTIKAGDKVTWENKSGGKITVNSDLHPTHLLYPPLNLGIVENGGMVSLVFDKPGTYGYHNHLNPSQSGRIIVE